MRLPTLVAVLAISTVLLRGADAAEQAEASLTVRNRAFEPTELQVRAGQKIELRVKNADSAPAEFESATLHREKIVPAGQEVTIIIGPLRAGTYEFFDDFNPQARGRIIAR